MTDWFALAKSILQPLGEPVKPRTAEEIAAWHNRPFSEITEEEWNHGARQADAHWADQPHERSVGREYKEHRGTTATGKVYVEQEWIK